MFYSLMLKSFESKPPSLSHNDVLHKFKAAITTIAILYVDLLRPSVDVDKLNIPIKILEKKKCMERGGSSEMTK